MHRGLCTIMVRGCILAMKLGLTRLLSWSGLVTRLCATLLGSVRVFGREVVIGIGLLQMRTPTLLQASF